jgi:hypothetical protein
LLVARSGARRSTSRASASAARRTSSKLQRRSIRMLTCMPREPDGLRPAREPAVVEHLAYDAGDVHDLAPADAGPGIEVDAQLVRMVEVVRAHRMRVQIDAAEVDDPEQLRGVAHDDLARRAAGGELQLHRVDPVRDAARRTLLKERLLVGSVHVTLEHDRPSRDAAQRALGDGRVVLRQL